MTITKLLNNKWTGPQGGPVRLSLIVVSIFIFTTFVSAQHATERQFVVDAVLGVGIGTSLDEAHQKLDSLGINGGRVTRSGGRKESWALESTEFSTVALKTKKSGKAVWVTGFVREGQEIPFEKLGDRAASSRYTKSEAIWNVETAEGGYRLVAKGNDGRARIVYLLTLEAPKVE